MRISSNNEGNLISKVGNERVISQCLEHEIFDDELFQDCSVSTQTTMDVVTVATQTPWPICIELGSNINCVSEEDSKEMSFQTNIVHISQHADSLNKFAFENDPTYVCDDELCEFLNKTEH